MFDQPGFRFALIENIFAARYFETASFRRSTSMSMELMFLKPDNLTATLIFYKPLWKIGGDVNEFLRLCREFSNFGHINVICIYPFFWRNNLKVEEPFLGKNFSISNRPVGPISIFLNIFVCFVTLAPIEFALFRRPLNDNLDADVIVCRGSRVFWNVKKVIRGDVKLILADSLGLTWRKKLEATNRPLMGWVLKIYSRLHLRNEIAQIGECNQAYVFDSSEKLIINDEIRKRRAHDLVDGAGEIQNELKYLKMSWSDVSAHAVSEVNPRAVSVFGKHGAAHNISRLRKLSEYADKHKELDFYIIGDLEGVPSALIKALGERRNVTVVGFIDRFDMLVASISKCAYSYHDYGWISGMQNTVLMAINLGQTLIADESVEMSVQAYFKGLDVEWRIQPTEDQLSYFRVGRRQPFSMSFLSQIFIADE